MTDIKKIDNFLFDDYFKELKDLVYSGDFSWYYADKTTTHKDDKNYMFSHGLYYNSINSDFFNKFEPIKYFISKHIECKKFHRLKLNLYPNQGRRIKHHKHYDWMNVENKPTKNVKIIILNFTDCNGATVVGDQEIASKANQAILFKNEQDHYGITQDDKNIRVVLNIIFE